MTPQKTGRRYLAVLLAALLPAAAAAVELPDVVRPQAPLWDAGLFGAYGTVPDYPAADQNHFHGIILPFFIYRGRLFRSDREGARAQFRLRRDVYLEISAAGSFPTDSHDNIARQGMPDIDWIGEIGPRLAWKIGDFGELGKLKFLLPLRAVFSTNFQDRFNSRGLIFPPALSFNSYNFLRPTWIGLIEAISSFGDRSINAYFYDVAPAYARADRPAYTARAGYLNTKLVAGLAIPIGSRLHFFNGASAAFNQGSANQDSPLYRSSVNWTWMMALSWRFFESSKPGTE